MLWNSVCMLALSSTVCNVDQALFLLAMAEYEHCGICNVLVISADRDVHEDDISPMTPITPSWISDIAENTACVMAACPSTAFGYESFSTSVMYAPGIRFWAFISATANRIAEIPLTIASLCKLALFLIYYILHTAIFFYLIVMTRVQPLLFWWNGSKTPTLSSTRELFLAEGLMNVVPFFRATWNV